MQKKIIAVAVAGLSTAAFAQTNVTIYGVADVSGQGYSLSQSKAPSKTQGGNQGNVFSVQSNSSLIGFKGTEDLGNGLQALFQAETTLNLAGQAPSTTGATGVSVNNSNSVFGALRDSFVGLNSKYGTGMAGYLSTPFRSSLTSFDVMPGATGSGSIETMNGIRIAQQGTNNTILGNKFAVNAVALSSSVRATAVAYALPTLYGFNGSIAYTGSANNGLGNNSLATTTCGTASADVSACSQNPQSAWGANLGWTGYGVNIQGAFQQANVNLRSNPDPVTGAVGEAGALGNFTSYLVGAGYTGIAGLKTSVVYTRNSLGIRPTVAAEQANKLSNNQLYAGVSYRLGNWEPRLSATWSSNVNGMTEVNQLGARQWTLNTGYYLSKRTQVYGLISNLNNSANQNYQMGQQANGMKPTGGENLFTYGAGLRTTF